jgi:hypothetical protein
MARRQPAYAPDLNPVEKVLANLRGVEPATSPAGKHLADITTAAHAAPALLVPACDRTPSVVTLPPYAANVSKEAAHAWELGGGVEANPGPVGQVGDPFGPQHPREGAKHAWQTPGRHDGHALGDHLAPGDLGTVDGHDRHHDLGVGQDLGGSVGLE